MSNYIRTINEFADDVGQEDVLLIFEIARTAVNNFGLMDTISDHLDVSLAYMEDVMVKLEEYMMEGG